MLHKSVYYCANRFMDGVYPLYQPALDYWSPSQASALRSAGLRFAQWLAPLRQLLRSATPTCAGSSLVFAFARPDGFRRLASDDYTTATVLGVGHPRRCLSLLYVSTRIEAKALLGALANKNVL
jgi:hypothetical protein